MSDTDRYHAYMIFAPAAEIATVNAVLEACHWGPNNVSTPIAALGPNDAPPAWDATPLGYMSHSTNLPLDAIRMVEDMTMGTLPTESFDPGIPEIVMSVTWGGDNPTEAEAIAAMATVEDMRQGYNDLGAYAPAASIDAFLTGLGLGKIPPQPQE